MTFPGFGDLHPTTRRLLMARALRSIGQGALVVDFTLYLNALHWSAIAIGLLLTAGGIFAAVLTLIIGMTSDRLRRKPILLVYEAVALLTGSALIFSSQGWVLVAGAIIGGFGRGANGAAGPFSPAEQAWLSEDIPPERRGRVYSLNSGLGFFGMAAGALCAILPAIWTNVLPGGSAYRPLFGLPALAAVGGIVLLTGAQEKYRQDPQPALNLQEKQHSDIVKHQENQILLKLVLVNGFNGFAIGMTGPLMSYWFAQRFGVGPESIAPVMAATYGITGVISLFTGRLTERIGIVSSVVWERVFSLGLLVLLPIMPTYGLASIAYLLRSALSRGSAGAQQALTIGLVRDERRGLATSLNAVSSQFPRSAGPGIAGYLLSLGQFELPFYIAALFQGIYLILYDRVFRKYDPHVDLLKDSTGLHDRDFRNDG
ncbi:MAG: MFS transporter [Chloroflexi bacterium]|nr:MFS transporter [Chloroflexota bacterium]